MVSVSVFFLVFQVNFCWPLYTPYNFPTQSPAVLCGWLPLSCAFTCISLLNRSWTCEEVIKQNTFNHNVQDNTVFRSKGIEAAQESWNIYMYAVQLDYYIIEAWSYHPPKKTYHIIT